MRDAFYLILDENGAKKMRSSKPNLNAGEVAILINVQISDKFFERFVPKASLNVSDDMVIEPEIKVEIEDPNK